MASWNEGRGGMPGAAPTPSLVRLAASVVVCVVLLLAVLGSARAETRDPFAGVGVFTTNDPASALGLRVSWVALEPQWATCADAHRLTDAGYTVVTWQGRATAEGVAFARACT